MCLHSRPLYLHDTDSALAVASLDGALYRGSDPPACAAHLRIPGESHAVPWRGEEYCAPSVSASRSLTPRLSGEVAPVTASVDLSLSLLRMQVGERTPVRSRPQSSLVAPDCAA